MPTQLANPVDLMIRRARVLLVEERPHLRKLMRNLLVNVGVKKIDEATDGIAGIEAIKSLDPDLAILSWELPLLNGAELVRIIRAPGVLARPSLPVILFGATANRRHVAEARRLGVNAYLILPISAKMLLDRMVSCLAPLLAQEMAARAPEKASDNIIVI
jgi:DNA-binding response OmpR family regulator